MNKMPHAMFKTCLFPLWIKQLPKYLFHKIFKRKSLWIAKKLPQAHSQLHKWVWFVLIQELAWFSQWTLPLHIHTLMNIWENHFFSFALHLSFTHHFSYTTVFLYHLWNCWCTLNFCWLYSHLIAVQVDCFR